MTSVLLSIAFVSLGAALGAAAGWWVHASGTPECEIPDPEPRSSGPPHDEEAIRSKLQVVETVMARLHQLAESVAADVGKHNVDVQKINEELSFKDQKVDVLEAIERLVSANETMQSQLRRAEERLQAQAKEIDTHIQKARTDALTQLGNRRAFDDKMQRCLEEMRASGRPACVLMLDVDHFKTCNDTHGHQAGDEVLRGVARVLRRTLTGEETICRYGGEEFGILFPGMDLAAALPVAERARAAVGQEVVPFAGLDLRVTASAGLAQLQPGETAEQLLQRADEALYASKRHGRDCGHWHDGKTTHLVQAPPGIAPSDTSQAEKRNGDSPASEGSPAADPAGAETPEMSDKRSFFADIHRRASEWNRGGACVSVLLVEVDQFAQLCAQHGAAAGEVVHQATTGVLRAALRDMDHVVRLEAQLYGILLPGADAQQAGMLAERIRRAVDRRTAATDGSSLAFTVSIGLAQIAGNEGGEGLMQRASAALESARNSGGNCSFSATGDGGSRPTLALPA